MLEVESEIRALLIARGLDVPEHLLQRVMTDLVLPADLALGHLLDQNSSANLRSNLHIAVHPSPVSLFDSLRNQLVSRDCWVWLFSISVYSVRPLTKEATVLAISEQNS